MPRDVARFKVFAQTYMYTTYIYTYIYIYHISISIIFYNSYTYILDQLILPWIIFDLSCYCFAKPVKGGDIQNILN